MALFSKSTDLATAIRAERDRMASTIAALRAQDAALGERITEIHQMRPGEEELREVLENSMRQLREQALKKWVRYLEPVVRGQADYAERLPVNILNHARDRDWHVSEFPSEFPVALVDVKTLVDEVMAYAGWQSPPLRKQERQQQIATLTAERKALAQQLTALQADCEQMGLTWPA
jgi:hypothetical protein